MIRYLVVVYANSPTEAKFISEANGCNRVYSCKNDANFDAKKANDRNGYGFAKVIAV